MASNITSRTVTVVLVDKNNRVLGSIGTAEADEPWLQQTAAVVRAVRDKWDIDVTLLRLLQSEQTDDAIYATYLGEVDPTKQNLPVLNSWQGELYEDDHRLPYAKPGGPAADLAWAIAALAAQNIELNQSAEQIRTWNLSSIWRLPTSAGEFWLKVVPPFFRHEGAVIESLQSEKVPRLFARSNGRVLMQCSPGKDCYDAALPQVLSMISELVGLQARWSERTHQLLEIGVPDQRGNKLVARIQQVIDRNIGSLDSDHQAMLSKFAMDLPNRMRKIEACNIPDTLVHGDYHPGNWRGENDNLVILDWGDCCVGHPLLDRPGLLERIKPESFATVDKHWRDTLKAHLPQADIDTACALIEPIAAAKMAMTYQMFLDNIEASEQIYHADDVPHWLRKTAQIWCQSQDSDT